VRFRRIEAFEAKIVSVEPEGVAINDTGLGGRVRLAVSIGTMMAGRARPCAEAALISTVS